MIAARAARRAFIVAAASHPQHRVLCLVFAAPVRVSAYLPSGKNGAFARSLYIPLKRRRAEFSQANSRRSQGGIAAGEFRAAGVQIIAARTGIATAAGGVRRAAFSRAKNVYQRGNSSRGIRAAFFRRRRGILSPVQQGVCGGGNCVRSYRGAFGNAVQNFRRRRLYIGAAKVPVHSRHSVQHSRALPQAFILPQAFEEVRFLPLPRNAAPPMILPSAFSCLAVRAIAKQTPPPRHIALHRLAAKRAFAFRDFVLRHFAESRAKTPRGENPPQRVAF